MLKIITAITLMGIASAATAGTGSQGYFEIYNDTSSNTVVGFYTNDGSGWSTNWLNVQLEPGEHATAEFSAVSGACDQTLQVGWLGQDGGEVMDDPIDIDICEASNVYLGDDQIEFD
ncbi:MAG: hypothetical protein P8N14_10980 [Sulfitobacter sp.]|jgi:hypothetical protein|nr:hypothetical protein [Sulfitobacter sp.]